MKQDTWITSEIYFEIQTTMQFQTACSDSTEDWQGCPSLLKKSHTEEKSDDLETSRLKSHSS